MFEKGSTVLKFSVFLDYTLGLNLRKLIEDVEEKTKEGRIIIIIIKIVGYRLKLLVTEAMIRYFKSSLAVTSERTFLSLKGRNTYMWC